jgi:hypothetical protein
MQTSSVWSRVIGTLCLPSNGILYAQNGERANFTSFPGAPHATITLYAPGQEISNLANLAEILIAL